MKLNWNVFEQVFVMLMAVLLVLVTGCSDSAPEAEKGDDASRPRQKIADKAKKRVKQAKRAAQDKVKPQRRNEGAAITEEDYPELSPADRKTAVSLQTALDADDFSAVRAAALKAMASSDPKLRKQAVDALAWFGAKALPELTSLLADADEDVASAALDAAATALSDMEDPKTQFDAAASYMTILASNSDAVDAFATTLSSAADAICIPEDDDNPKDVAKAAANRNLVVSTFGKMIATGGKLAEETKEAYSFVTGHDWVSQQEANLWAKDPDGYEPPETEDE